MAQTVIHPHPNRQSGFSLVELMVSMAIGLVILLAIISMLVTSSRTQKELQSSSDIEENGSYSINTLYEELRHTGYFGHYFQSTPTTPATLPDPCAIDATSLLSAIALPIQGYRATSKTSRPDISSTSCQTSYLPNANLQPGSDIIVMRRADTAVLSGTPVTNEVYLQANVTTAAIQFGSSTANVPSTTADGGVVSINKRNGATVSAADTRKLHVTLFFVAPCSVGSGTNGICTSSDDTIPTLKRLDLTAASGATAMVITPVAEGVEFMKVLYGIDTDTATNSQTGMVGSGVPSTYSNAPTLSQWTSVMSVQAWLLVRTLSQSAGQSDNKSYTLADITLTATDLNTAYRRHLFSSEVRLTNLAGPRSLE